MVIDYQMPIILIGKIGECKAAEFVADGIEENGCMFNEYIAVNEDDIRYSSLGTTVLVSDEKAVLYVKTLGRKFIQEEDAKDRASCFCLGKNAARYVKGKPMELK